MDEKEAEAHPVMGTIFLVMCTIWILVMLSLLEIVFKGNAVLLI